ncbi:hypothetical protein ACFL1R_12085 [Candidatus Latescibacterota bacterium]
MEIDSGLKALTDLISLFGNYDLSKSNEADTRKKVIDGILENVLGWDNIADIHYETRISEDKTVEYADYIINTATTSIVIEAKKIGKTFVIPSKRKTGKLGGFLSQGETGKAIKQVREYARKLSIPFAVITNGNTWIIFPAVRTDGITFKETQAKIFRNLADIKDRFVEFWELLSRQRVIESNLENELLGSKTIYESRRLLSRLHEPGYRLGRNSLYEHIEPAVNVALTDEALLEDVEALRECYVRSSGRVKHDSRLHMYLSDIKPSLDRKVVRVKKSKGTRYLDNLLEKGNIVQHFILILGQVGAGKTTFLYYTRHVSAYSLINKKIIWLYIDFKQATIADNPREFIYRELLRKIEEDSFFLLGDWDKSIKPAYNEEIKNYKRGPLKPIYRADEKEFDKLISEQIYMDRKKVNPYVEMILSNASIKWPVYLIIDNVDQIEDEKVQNTIFSEAQAAARKMNMNVIMSLRDSTYLRHRNSPVFDAFQVDSIYIDPPLIKPVLSKRFEYAKRVLDNKKAEIISESGKRFIVPDLGVFFKIVSSSLLSEDSGYLLEVLSEGNVRRGINLIREFLTSGHVNADYALSTYLTKGIYKFPIHEIFKGAIFGQKKYYREEGSLLLNIFDSKLDAPFTQLLRLRILFLFVNKASIATFEGISVQDIISELYQVGISERQVFKTLQDLFNFHAIRSVDGMPLAHESKIISTRLGGYLIHSLAYKLMYLEPCLIESHIYDDDFWGDLYEYTRKIEIVSHYERIDIRLKRIKLYIEYLKIIDQSWIVKCKRFLLKDLWCENIIGSIIVPKIQDEFDKITKSAIRTQKRRDEADF